MKDIVALAQEAGEFITSDDGFVCFWPKVAGAYSSSDLLALADELDRRNAGWNAEIDAYHAAQEDSHE